MSTRTKPDFRVVVNARRLREEARKRNWKNDTQTAEALGMTPSSLHKLLSGKTEPLATTIDRILAEFDLPYRTLFTREEREQ